MSKFNPGVFGKDLPVFMDALKCVGGYGEGLFPIITKRERFPRFDVLTQVLIKDVSIKVGLLDSYPMVEIYKAGFPYPVFYSTHPKSAVRLSDATL